MHTDTQTDTYTHTTHTPLYTPQVLIYLNTVAVGGKTSFPRLNVAITPVRGTAVVFFPARLDGRLDEWVRLD